MKRAIVPILIVALAVVALVAVPAFGTRVVKFNSKVTVASHELVFHGKVKSGSPGCRGGRTVNLKRVFGGGPNQTVGHDVTDSHGRWRIVPQGSAGISLAHFYAHVRRSSQGTAGTIYVCRGDSSKIVGANDN
jgi:hypothetical protein